MSYMAIWVREARLHPSQLRSIREVCHEHLRTARQRRSHLVQPSLIACHEYDVVSARGECPSRGRTDPRGCARDERRACSRLRHGAPLAVSSGHEVSLALMRVTGRGQRSPSVGSSWRRPRSVPGA